MVDAINHSGKEEEVVLAPNEAHGISNPESVTCRLNRFAKLSVNLSRN
jgi:dipeptidyl aminopeptidase/acylaminoacyl peptidase